MHRLSSIDSIKTFQEKTSAASDNEEARVTYGVEILTSRFSFLGRKGSTFVTKLIQSPLIAQHLVVLTLRIQLRSGAPFSLHGASFPQLLTFSTNLPHRIIHRLLLDHPTFAPKLQDLLVAECRTALCPLGNPDLAALDIALMRVQGPPLCAALLSSTCHPAQIQFRWERRAALRSEALRILSTLHDSRVTKISLFFTSLEHRVLSRIRSLGGPGVASSLYEIELKEHLLPVGLIYLAA